MSTTIELTGSVVRPADVARLASVGLRSRKLRAGLSALGIAIGVAAIVAVLGLSSSSQAGLLAEISQLGTNVLTVSNGQTIFGQPAELPKQAAAMIGQISGVTAVQDTAYLSNATVFRSPLIPTIDTNAISVQAASLGLLKATGDTVAYGSSSTPRLQESRSPCSGSRWRRLGILTESFTGERIWLDNQWFYVAWHLNPAGAGHPSIDSFGSRRIPCRGDVPRL